MYSSILDISSLPLTVCSTSLDTNCLSDCWILNYLGQNSCEPCPSGCSTEGCKSGYVCFVCVNQICATCEDYDSCSSSISNAELNSTSSLCECKEGYYWDTVNLVCGGCSPICDRCSGPDASDCDCGADAFVADYACVCNQGFAMIGGSCQACDSSCLTCYGNEFYQCLTCNEVLLEGICSEVCPIGYIVDNGGS